MPPPPPPSASYLLVLDSDSEKEDDDRNSSHFVSLSNIQTVVPTVSEYPQSANQTPPPVSGARRPHIVEEENDDEDDDVDTSIDGGRIGTSGESTPTAQSSTQERNTTKQLNKNQKRKLRRKKKKSKFGEGNTSETTFSDSVVCAKRTSVRVSFSKVSVRMYPRAFSTDAVPADGGWPLGMELDHFEDQEPIDLEDFERDKQEALSDRWKTIRVEVEKLAHSSPLSTASNCKSSSSSRDNKEKSARPINAEVIRLMEDLHSVKIGKNQNQDLSSTIVYETRQWDYRSGVKNPLFGVVPETMRQAIFLAASGGSEEDQQLEKQLQHQQNGGRVSHANGTERSNHVSSTSLAQSPKQHGSNARRSRSNSNGAHGNISQNFNDTYTQVYVMHVRNELEQLRIERNKSGATGCNCRKLNIYIPPKDGSAGKKAHHKRLKPSKLSQELKRRGLFNQSMSRDEMEKVLQTAIEKEPCCRDDDCFCVRNGIDCQADACSCWHDSHVHVKRYSDSAALSTEDIKQRCGNPLGMYVVDLSFIDDFRSKLVANQKETGLLFCLPAASTVESSQHNRENERPSDRKLLDFE